MAFPSEQRRDLNIKKTSGWARVNQGNALVDELAQGVVEVCFSVSWLLISSLKVEKLVRTRGDCKMEFLQCLLRIGVQMDGDWRGAKQFCI